MKSGMETGQKNIYWNRNEVVNQETQFFFSSLDGIEFFFFSQFSFYDSVLKWKLSINFHVSFVSFFFRCTRQVLMNSSLNDQKILESHTVCVYAYDFCQSNKSYIRHHHHQIVIPSIHVKFIKSSWYSRASPCSLPWTVLRNNNTKLFERRKNIYL